MPITIYSKVTGKGGCTRSMACKSTGASAARDEDLFSHMGQSAPTDMQVMIYFFFFWGGISYMKTVLDRSDDDCGACNAGCPDGY
jgi:hypothetical protein